MKRNDPPEADRDAILARRALFVTTAIAALGCSSSGQSGSAGSAVLEPQVTASAAQAAPSNEPAGSASAAAPGGSEARRAAWQERRAAAPPLDADSSLPKREKDALDELAKELTAEYETLGKAWIAAPLRCAPNAGGCIDAWAQAARVVAQLRDGLPRPKCGWHAGLAYVQRYSAHSAYIKALARELEAELSEAAVQMRDPGTWPGLLRDAARPEACLKCAVPPQSGVLDNPYGGQPLVASFASGDARLGPAALTVLAEVKKAIEEFDMNPVEVRGHADPGEPGDPKALARARAEAARDWLVKNGLKKDRLIVVTYGAGLPIGAQSEAGRASNRRVDFEAVPKK